MSFSISHIVAGMAILSCAFCASASAFEPSARTLDTAFKDAVLHQGRQLQAINLDQVGEPIFGKPANVPDRGQVLFGSYVSLSSDGSRLLVGAPANDYDKDGVLSVNSGSVTLYMLNDQFEWEPLWTLNGDPGEGIGEYLSMNNAGTLVAVRRTNKAPHSVQVYNPDTGVMVGSAISCRNQGTTSINGDFVALSPDGRRIALNCRTSFGRVQIFNLGATDWESNGEMNGIAAQDLFGFSFSFAGSGNRIAISSPNHDPSSIGNAGLIQVYDYGGSAWTQVGQNVFGLAASQTFGSALDLSDDGTTLVVSAPSASTGNGDLAEHVRTLYYDNGSKLWTEFGGVVEGKAQDRFGRTVSISADGRRFMASSWTSNTSRGYVKLFELPSLDGSWTEIASMTGTEVGDRLGFGRSGIYLTPDGMHMAIGETWTNDPAQNGASTGRAVVLSTPSLKTNIAAPSASPTKAPVTLPSAAPKDTPLPTPTPNASPAPSTVVVTAKTASPTGAPTAGGSTLRPTKRPTSSPTRSPTSSPTRGPTSSPTTTNPTFTTASVTSPPASFGVTSSPSSLSTTADGSMGVFDYDIQRIGEIDVEFSDERSDMEIILAYNINIRKALVQVFQEDCVTKVPNSTIGINATATPYSATHATLTVMLDVMQESIFNSPIYETIDAESAAISFCIRVDLLTNGGEFDGESVVFHESVFFVDLDLTNGFKTTNTLEREDADIHTSSVDLQYGIEACHCDGNYECLAEDTTVTQNSVINICLSSDARNVSIADVLEAVLQQGSLTNVAIQDSVENQFTQVKLLPDGSAVITTFLLSFFFEQPDPLPITVSGTVSLSFDNGAGGTRSLRALTDDSDADFGLKLHVSNVASAASKTMPTVLISVVALAASAWFL